MAEDEKGTSADAEVPEENNVNDAAEAAPVEETVEQPAAEEPAAEEPVAEPADETVGETTEDPETADEAVAEAPGTSASAEVPTAKPKKKRLPRSQRRQRPAKKRPASTERKPIVRLEKPEHARGRRQERQGTVVSDAMEKTIVVKVEVVKAHPKYKKVVRRSVKFHAHDEASAAKVGDVVRIVETRPLSKTKHWRLAEVVEAAK
jgi:small subunit ribosomal protein S17